jgi:hypothetical protein
MSGCRRIGLFKRVSKGPSRCAREWRGRRGEVEGEREREGAMGKKVKRERDEFIGRFHCSFDGRCEYVRREGTNANDG